MSEWLLVRVTLVIPFPAAYSALQSLWAFYKCHGNVRTLGLRHMSTILKVCFVASWILMEEENLPDNIGLALNPYVLELIYTRGAQQGLLQGGVQIYHQGHSLWWVIHILHFTNASVELSTGGKIIQWFAYISMTDRNTMCSWRAIREIDFFFLFLGTLFLLLGSSSSAHQYISSFSYMGANFPTGLSLLQVYINWIICLFKMEQNFHEDLLCAV